MINIIIVILAMSVGCISGFILSTLIISNKTRGTMKFINIDKLEVTIDKQNRKCIDELTEFISGVKIDNPDNIIEEFFDVIQAMLGVIKLLGIQHMLRPGLVKHNKKLKSRGWEFSDIE